MREGLHKIAAVGETIVAISTPLGRSGIGVVRLSGKDVGAVAKKLFRSLKPLEHRVVTHGTWLAESGEAVDDVLVTYFRSPDSYTGEDVIEVSAHGNPLVLKRIVTTAKGAGARLANPGEFTLRAVMNGKMDLTQAEAVREFIDAQTELQSRAALRQMEGAVSKRIRPVKERLIGVIARLEAGIDFAEDDVEVPNPTLMVRRVDDVRSDLVKVQQNFAYGKLLANGLCLTIIGKPNVGKSSLFNCFVSQDRAIVTEIPGTTRDVLTESIELDGIPLKFADTAGVRHASDKVERIGVERTFETLTETDLALIVLDGSVSFDDNDHEVLRRAAPVPHLLVINKIDLPQVLDASVLDGKIALRVSAATGEGVAEVRRAICDYMSTRRPSGTDDVVLTSERQHEAVQRAICALETAARAFGEGVPHEMVLLDLYEALAGLDELTGDSTTDDILERIFSSFCIGK